MQDSHNGVPLVHIEVNVDLSMLSSKGQELLKGKKMIHQERLELMHLHTISHGTYISRV